MVDTYKIAIVHYPDQAHNLASEDKYDIVCCGHSHVPMVRQYAQTLMINPGQLLGENDQAGFVIVDFDAGTTQRIGVGNCMFDRDIPISESAPQEVSLPPIIKTDNGEI